jgi:hypothetical protein
MLDRLSLPLIALIAIAVIVLAMVWPQGYGARSPAPFGHTPIQQTPEMQAAMKRETDAAVRRQREAEAAVAGRSGPRVTTPASEPPPPGPSPQLLAAPSASSAAAPATAPAR